MKKINLLKVMIFTAAILSITVPGYCPFRDDVDPQQVRTRVLMQRERDEDSLKENELIRKQKEILKASRLRQEQNVKTSAAQKTNSLKGNAAGQNQTPATAVNYYGFTRGKDNAQQQNVNNSPENKKRSVGFWVTIIILVTAIALLLQVREKEEKSLSSKAKRS